MIKYIKMMITYNREENKQIEHVLLMHIDGLYTIVPKPGETHINSLSESCMVFRK